MRKKVLLWMTVILLLVCTACGMDSNGQNAKNFAQENVAGVYPMTLVDQAGREVVLEKKAERLVSVYYITTSALLALDLKENIVGIETNPEKRNIYNLCAKELFEVTQVGSPKELDIEVCAAVKPDLVILPMRAKNMVEPLEKLGITVMVVNPESQDEVLEMLQLIGKATGQESRAQKIVNYIQSKTEYLKEKLADLDRPSVYLGGNSSFFSTASKGMYQNDMITLAGGKNVADQIDDTYWVEVSYEQILEWNPAYIFAASAAKYTLDEVKNDTNLTYVEAVGNDNIYKIPSDVEDWDSPVPSGFLGAVYMASVVHPDVVSNEQYEDMVKEYYETFYGFSYTKE